MSNLGVFDFETPDHRMRLRSLHPGVTVDEVVAATGFELVIPDDVPDSAGCPPPRSSGSSTRSSTPPAPAAARSPTRPDAVAYRIGRRTATVLGLAYARAPW